MEVNEDGGQVTRSWESFDAQLLEPLDEFQLDLRDVPSDPPAFTFNLEERRLVGTGVTEVTDASLLRYTLQLLETTCGPQVEKYRTISDPALRDVQLQTSKRFLDAKISMAGDKRAKRREIINLNTTLDEVEEQLRATHDPTYQLLEQIKQQFGDIMEPTRLYNLRLNILTVTQWAQIKDSVTRHINIEKARRAAQVA